MEKIIEKILIKVCNWFYSFKQSLYWQSEERMSEMHYDMLYKISHLKKVK
jgi:hypothetical protein